MEKSSFVGVAWHAVARLVWDMTDEPFLAEGRRGKRKLSKLNSHPRDVAVQQHLCISGGWMKKPIHLDVTDFAGTEMVSVQSTSIWLPQILQGFCRYQSLGSLLKSVSQDLQSQVLRCTGEAAEAQAAKAGGLRADLWEDEASQNDVSEDTPKKPSAHRKCLREASVVSHRGHTLTCAWRRNTFYVAATSESMAALVEILRSYTKTEVTEKSPQKPNQKQKDPDQIEEAEGCVAWNFPGKTWVVRYLDADGKKHSRTKGLSVPDKGFDGATLPIADYKRIRREVQSRVVSLWNELDKSDRPRLEIPQA